VRGADRYGLEIARENTVVASKEARETTVSAPLEPGKYQWRVRGHEADGQAGAWSPHNVVILPPPPPRDLKADIKASPVVLTWQGKAPRYRVEVAADAGFAKPVLGMETEVSSALLKDLAPGDYFVRVTAMGAEGVASLPSQALPLTVERPSPWWLLLPLLLLI
jgi:hypothetical protein